MNFREQIRRGALDVEQVLALDAHLGHTGQQRPCVGVAGVIVDVVRGADLHDVARIHDGHPVSDVGHDAEVVGDENDGQLVLDLHLLEQLQNLRLNGHVQRGGGFVADQDLRVAGHGNGDDDALAHTAGKFMGVLAEAHFGVRNAHVPQVFQRLFLGSLAVQPLMQLHGLHDLIADGLQRVQAGHGVLHDHGDLMAADAEPVLFLFQVGQADGLAVVGTEVVDGAGGDGAVGVQQAHEALGEDALARTGFAHNGEDFAVVDVEVDAPDGVEHFSTQIELDVQTLDRKDQLIFFHLLSLLTADGSSGRRRRRRRCRSDRTRW